MRRGSSRKKKKDKCSATDAEKIPTVSFTQSDHDTAGYKRYPTPSDANSLQREIEKTVKKVSTLQLKEKAIMLGGEEEEELLDYSPKEGDATTSLDSARLTYRIWGDGQLCENKKTNEKLKICIL